MNKIFIKQAALSKFGKSEKSLLKLIRESVENLQTDLSEIDAVFIGLMNPSSFAGIGNIASYVTDKINLSGIPSVRIETASSSGAAALYYAFASLKAGIYKNVLVIAAEKMTSLSTPKVTKIISEVIDPVENKTGASMPSLAALVTRRFAYENKISEDLLIKILSEIAIKNHHYGMYNEFAHIHKKITFENYKQSKFISEPLRLFDCAPISDGACSLILSSEAGNVEIAGVGQGTDKQALCKRKTLTSFNSTKKAAKEAFDMSNISPSNIDFAEIHDAFTTFELTGLIDTGLVDKEKIIDFYLESKGYHNGILPVNISGGLKSRGHPVGASGLAQIVEAFKIINEEYPEKITPKKHMTALTQSIGGLASNNFVIILKHINCSYKFVNIPFSINSIEKKERKGRLPRIYSYTTLHTTPEGIPSPLTLTIINRRGKKILARYNSHIKPEIGMSIHIAEKNDGILYVEPLRKKIFK
jgi:acetyl-CoA acetyltransferase